MDDLPIVADLDDRDHGQQLRPAGVAGTGDAALHASFFEDGPDPHLITDDRGRVVAANSAARSLLPPDLEAEHRSIATWFSPDDQPQVLRAIAGLGEGGASRCDLHGEVRSGDQEGVKVWARAFCCAPADGDDDRQHIFWSVRVLQDEDEAIHQLARASALKDSYLLAVAHDLRTPVTVVTGTVDLLRSHADEPDKVRELTGLLDRSVHAIKQVIADVLDVERLEHGSLQVLRRRTDLHRLVRRSLTEARLRSPLSLEVPNGSAVIDRGLAERILVNLLVNADHHNPPGAPIRLRIDADPAGVLFQVVDHGPGIPDSEKEDVFRLFHRLSSTGSGVGVGLFLVRRIAEMHDGWAKVDDAPDGGARVQVYLRS